APVAAPAEPEGPEVISDAQQALMDAAKKAESLGPDKAVEAWKKAVAADAARRAPRRELVRVLRKAERWTALVEALKDEESHACTRPDDKAAVLGEIAEVYRERLKLDVMVANTLAQIVQLQPGNADALDQLAAQYEAMKRWPDLIKTLAAKAGRVGDVAERVALHVRVANLWIEKAANQGEAIKACEAALDLDGGAREALALVKQLYERRKDWEKLVITERRELALEEDAAVRRDRGLALARLAAEKVKKPALLVDLWADVLAVDASNADALAELEKLYEATKQWDRLADVCARLAESAPDVPRRSAMLQKLGALYVEKLNDQERGITAWREVLALEPENRRALDAVKKLWIARRNWSELEAFHAESGKLDELVRLLERQVEIDAVEARAELWEKIALLYRDRLAKPDRAMRAFEKLLALDHANALAAEALIPLYEQAKDWKKLVIALEAQLPQLAEASERQERMLRLAGIHEQQLKDKGAAYRFWLMALGEDAGSSFIHGEVERLAREIGAWQELVDGFRAAAAKLTVEIDALPLLVVMAKAQEAELGDLDGALESSRRTLVLDNSNVEALDAMQRILGARQQWGELLDVYARKLELSSDDEMRRQLMGRVAQLHEEALGDDAKAVAAWQAVLDAFGDEVEALGAMARIHERREEWRQLAEVLDRQLGQVLSSEIEQLTTLRLRLGRVRETRLSDREGALSCYRDVLESDPTHTGAREALEGRLADAETELAAANLLEPVYEKFEAWEKLVAALEIQVRHEEGIERRADLLLRIGDLHARRLGDAVSSFEAYTRCFRADPTRADARAELERLAELLDDGGSRMVALYEEALARELEPPVAYELTFKIAHHHDERGDDLDRAADFYQRALGIDASAHKAIDALDRLYSRLGRHADLIEIHRRRADLATEPAQRVEFLSRIARIQEVELRNTVEAIGTWREALGHDSGHLPSLEALDRLHEADGQWDDLADILGRQSSVHSESDRPRGATLLVRLGDLREHRLGQRAAAVDTYRQALELDHSNDRAVAALTKLLADPEYEQQVATILEPVHQARGDWRRQVDTAEVLARHAFDPSRRIEILLRIGETWELGGDDASCSFDAYARALREDAGASETRQRLARLAREQSLQQQWVTLLDEVAASTTDEAVRAGLLVESARVRHHDLGGGADAARAYERVLEVEPGNLDAITALQTIYEETGDFERLVDVLRRRAEVVSDLGERKLLFHRVAEIEEALLDRPDGAINAFRAVLVFDDADGASLDALERLFVKSGRWSDVRDIYARKAELSSDPAEKKRILFVLGQVHDRELGDVPRAIETYQAIINLDPEDADAISALERLYGTAGRSFDLLGILERQLQLSTSAALTGGLKFRIGQLWETELKDGARAVESYREALAIDPASEQVLEALTRMMRGEAEPLLAARVLQPIFEAIEAHELCAEAFEVLAAREEGPSRRLELAHRAADLHEHVLERPAAAFAVLARTIEVDPAHEETVVRLERLVDVTRAWDDLAALFDRLLRRDLDVAVLVAYSGRLGRLLDEELGRPADAIVAYRRVLDADTREPRARAALPRLYEATERWDELCDHFRTEARLGVSDEEIATALFAQAEVERRRRGDETAALGLYLQILGERDPAHAGTIRSLEELFAAGGPNQTEVGALLEPVYRDTHDSPRLHGLLEARLTRIELPADRQTTLQALAELAERELQDAALAGRWWAQAFAEDSSRHWASAHAERLARVSGAWDDLGATYETILSGRLDEGTRRTVQLLAGRLYAEELGDLTRGERAYRAALAIESHDGEALAALDRIYERGARWPEFVEVLGRRIAIAVETDDIIALELRLGRVHDEALLDDDAAIAAYDRVLEHNAGNREALERLEAVHVRRTDFVALLTVYERLLDVARDDAELAEVYARMARVTADAQDDDERAVDLWGRVTALRGDDPIALDGLGEIHERREEWAALVDILERRGGLGGNVNGMIANYKWLARIQLDRLGAHDASVGAWMRAHALDSRDLESLGALASLHRTSESWSALAETLSRSLEAARTTGELSEAELINLWAELGQVEGERLDHLEPALHAWRTVSELAPTDFRALDALESLYSRHGRWTECIDTLERRAAVVEDAAERIATLLKVGAIQEERLGDTARAVATYEGVRAEEPANLDASLRLEGILRAQSDWQKVIELLLERVETRTDIRERITALQLVSAVYEEHLGDADSAFLVLQEAFREDYSAESTARELERLAQASGRWNELLAEYSQVAQSLEAAEPMRAADLWVKIARWYAEQILMDHAMHSVQQSLRIDAAHLGALAALGDFHRRRGAWTDLVETVLRRIAAETDADRRAELQLSLGELYESQLGDALRAIEAYRAALDADTTVGQAVGALERLYRRLEQWEPLIQILFRKSEATSDPDERARLDLEIGHLLEDRVGDPSKAIAAFKNALVAEPRSRSALRALERLYERGQDHEAYLDVLDRQLDTAETDTERLASLAKLAKAQEERLARPDRAIDAWERAILLDSRSLAVYGELARLYRRQRRWDGLIDTLRRQLLAGTDPAVSADLSCQLGQIYEQELTDVDHAIAAYEDALGMLPDDARAMDALGRLYERAGKPERAVEVMTRLAEKTEVVALRSDLQQRIGRIQSEQLGDESGAEEHYLRALADNPSSGPAMLSLVALYRRRGDTLKAAQLMVRAETVTQLPLEKVRLLHEAATAWHRELGDEERAMELYAAALVIDPEHVEAGEAYAELLWERKRWAELEPLLEMLVRKAAHQKKDARRILELTFRVARAAEELSKNEKALKFYKQAHDLDPTSLPTLKARGNLLYKVEDWEGAGRLYQSILVQQRDVQDDGEVVDVYYRLGQVRARLGEKKKALNLLEKALEIQPGHRPSLEALAEIHAAQGTWDAVIEVKRVIAADADADERFKMLLEIADLAREKMKDIARSIEACEEARTIRPEDHRLMHQLLENYTESKQWRQAIDIMLQFAERETNPTARGRYFYSAGVTSRDENHAPDEAIEHFNKALDAYFSATEQASVAEDPRVLKAFEAIDKLLTAKKDWKQLERAYRKMIKRMPMRPGDKLLIMLWHSLGEIYRTRLGDLKAATAAFEVASQLDAGNQQRHQILAELYTSAGPEQAENAAKQHQILLQLEPGRVDSYKALHRLYLDSQKYDQAWCAASVLAVLKKADVNEQQFFETYRVKGLVKPKERMTEETWQKLIPPEQNRYVNAIFGVVWYGASMISARAHKDFGLRRKDRRPIENDQLLFSKVFAHLAKTMSVPVPEVYLQPEQQGEILLANCQEKGVLVPSCVVRANLLQGRPDKEIAFSSAKFLTYMRPEHYLKYALQTNVELKTVLLSSIAMVQPGFPVKPDLAPAVAQYLPVLRSKLPPQQLEQLIKVVQKFLQNPTDVDLSRWGNAVESTANRAALTLTGDLELAYRMVKQTASPTAQAQADDLLLFAVSEPYFEARRALGIAIG
ncbi:MAG: tetratricopeptide repeat protein, partial [Myxococcales bacterium]|nr:tetratricopeptide repeat protein [Myxococcales bacterium]